MLWSAQHWSSWDGVEQFTACRNTINLAVSLKDCATVHLLDNDRIHLISSMFNTCTTEQQSALSNCKAVA